MEIITITPDDLRKLIREEVEAALAGVAVTQSVDDQEVLTLAEARDLLRVSDSTIRRMVRQREIESFSVRSRIYIRRMDIDNWMQSKIKAI